MFSEHGRPVFIDTLSFERYREGQGWVAYRQFCQHFLAPLALMRFTDVRLSQLFRVFLDGVPLDLATSLLPASTWLRPSLLAHIHLHAMAQRRFAHRPSAAKGRTNVSRTGLVGLVDHLDAAIRRLSWQARSSEWADYYDSANYSEVAAADKERLVRELVSQIQPGVVWDLGANTGRYSRVCAELGALTLAFDADAVAVELHYQACREQKDGAGVLPLVLDFTNPSRKFPLLSSG
jgi:hypothetical protein